MHLVTEAYILLLAIYLSNVGYGIAAPPPGDPFGPNSTEVQNNANTTFTPICEPGCKNKGVCVNTNTCECPTNFHGSNCELENKPCLDLPPLPNNTLRKCTAELCTFTCVEEHRFIDRYNVFHMRCVDGQWQLTRSDYASVPDCLPMCTPARYPCQNGGVCVANECQCPPGFRGPQCDYSDRQWPRIYIPKIND